mgnify:CR=1 FL=1
MYLFDMDGTLIDSNDVWKDVDREFLARRGLPYTKAYYEGVAHTIFPLAAKFTKEFCNLPDSEEDIMAEWMELAKDAYAHVTVKPGVRAFLKQCKAENRRMALVTSSVPVHCRTAMEKLDLMKFMTASGLLCVICYLLTSLSANPLIGLSGCILCGFSVGIMWPGTISLSSKKFPAGGTAMFALLAMAGDLGGSIGPGIVGSITQNAGDNIRIGMRTGLVFPIVLLLMLFLLRIKKNPEKN